MHTSSSMSTNLLAKFFTITKNAITCISFYADKKCKTIKMQYNKTANLLSLQCNNKKSSCSCDGNIKGIEYFLLRVATMYNNYST